MPGTGVETAATAIVGQAVGAERRDLAFSFARLSTAFGMTVMAAMGIIMYVTAPQVLSMLTSDAEVIGLGVTVLRIEAFAEPLYGASMVAAGALRGAGDTLMPSIFSLVSMWGIRVSLSAFAASRWGLPGVWFAMAIELCTRGTMFLIRLMRGRWLAKAVVSCSR